MSGCLTLFHGCYPWLMLLLKAKKKINQIIMHYQCLDGKATRIDFLSSLPISPLCYLDTSNNIHLRKCMSPLEVYIAYTVYCITAHLHILSFWTFFLSSCYQWWYWWSELLKLQIWCDWIVCVHLAAGSKTVQVRCIRGWSKGNNCCSQLHNDGSGINWCPSCVCLSLLFKPKPYPLICTLSFIFALYCLNGKYSAFNN